jgi:hypothetical protein
MVALLVDRMTGHAEPDPVDNYAGIAGVLAGVDEIHRPALNRIRKAVLNKGLGRKRTIRSENKLGAGNL